MWFGDIQLLATVDIRVKLLIIGVSQLIFFVALDVDVTW